MTARIRAIDVGISRRTTLMTNRDHILTHPLSQSLIEHKIHPLELKSIVG